MNNKTEKIKKMSKILDAVLKITAIILIMAIVTMTILVVIAPRLDLDNFTIIGMIGGNIPFIGGDADAFRTLMTFEILNIIPIIAILFVASFIFKSISRGGSPFTQKNANRLKIISLLLIALGAVVPPLQVLITWIFIPLGSVTVHFNFTYVIFAAVFFCLALIFEYGAELQQQSDETL